MTVSSCPATACTLLVHCEARHGECLCILHTGWQMRAQKGNQHGIILLPEGLIEHVPEVSGL